MVRVKFPTEVKYNGVRYPAHTPFDVEDRDLDSIVKSGAFVLSERPVEVEKPLVPTPVTPLWDAEEQEEVTRDEQSEEVYEPEKEIDFRRFTVFELKKYARDRDIDVRGVEKKADLISLISSRA